MMIFGYSSLLLAFLHTIIETAPQEWEGLLSGFTQTLNQWTTSNLEVLSALTNKAETDATQAELIRELSHTLRALTTLMTGQKQLLQRLGKTSTTPGTPLTDLRETLTCRLNELSQQIKTISMTHSSSGNMQNTRLRNPSGSFGHMTDSRLKVQRLSASLLSLLLAVTTAGGWFLWRGQQHNTQRLQWLLIKANRAECLSGIRPAGSPECVRW